MDRSHYSIHLNILQASREEDLALNDVCCFLGLCNDKAAMHHSGKSAGALLTQKNCHRMSIPSKWTRPFWGDRLLEVTQKPFFGPGSLSFQCRQWESLKVLAGWAFCEMLSQCPQSAFQGFSGVARGGQQQFATQTLRVHLLGVDHSGKGNHFAGGRGASDTLHRCISDASMHSAILFAGPELPFESKSLPAVLWLLRFRLRIYFSPNYRYRYRLEIRMNSFNYQYRYRLGVRSHTFISIDSQLPSWK